MESKAFSDFAYFALSRVANVGMLKDTPSNGRSNKVTVNSVIHSAYSDENNETGKSGTYMAMLCSNDCIVVRCIQNNEKDNQTSSSPIIRIITWFCESNIRIVSMDFSPNAEWLVCASSEATIFSVPVRTLVEEHLNVNKNGVINSFFFAQMTKLNRNKPQGHAISKENTNQDFARPLPSLHDMFSSVTISTKRDPEPQKNPVSSSQSVPETRVAPLSRSCISELKVASNLTVISSCIWWNSFEKEDFVITATFDGMLIFTSMLTNIQNTVKFNGPIMKMELMIHDNPTANVPCFPQTNTMFPFIWNTDKTDYQNRSSGLQSLIGRSPSLNTSNTSPKRSNMSGQSITDEKSQSLSQWKALLIHSANGVAYIMILEYRKRGRVAQHCSYPSSPNDSKFKPVKIERFAKNSQLRVQYLGHHPCISVFNVQEALLELYEIGQIVDGKAYMKILPPTSSSIHHFSKDFVFCIGRVKDSSQIQVLSIKAAIDAALLETEEPLDMRNSVVQMLTMPKVFGIFPSHCIDSFFCWTIDDVFECHWNERVDAEIAKMAHKEDGSLFEKVVSRFPSEMPASKYFEIAANAEFERGQYQQAAKLYKNIATTKVCLKTVQRLMSVQCWWYALDMLRISIFSPQFPSFSTEFRTNACDMAVQCYIKVESECLIRKNSLVIDETSFAKWEGFSCKLDEFRVFLDSNKDFSISPAIKLLLTSVGFSFGLNYSLRASHARGAVAECLDEISKCGLHFVSAAEVGFLFNRGYAQLLLQSDSGGHVFRCLPSWQQLEVILLEMVPVASVTPMQQTDVDNKLIQAQIATIQGLVPTLDKKRLVQLLKFIDPGIFHRGIIWAQDQRHSKLHIMELFLSSILRLCFLASESQNVDNCSVHELLRPIISRASGRSKSKKILKSSEENYTQQVLEVALTKFWGTYRVSELLNRCFDWKNWGAASLIYEHAGLYSDSFETQLTLAGHQLHCIERKTSKCTENEEEEMCQSVLSLIRNEELLKYISNSTEKARVLTLFLHFWQRHFPSRFAILETTLIETVSYLYDALSILLFESVGLHNLNEMTEQKIQEKGSMFKSRWPHLSVSVYLAVSREKLNQVAQLPSVNTLGKLGDIGRGGMMSGRLFQNSASSVNRLWSEIVANLDKDADKFTGAEFCNIHHLPVSATRDVKEQKEESKKKKGKNDSIVVFTCGHAYEHDYFELCLVPELMRRLETLTPSIPATAEMIQSQYQQKLIELACPPCLFSYLLQEQNRLHRNMNQATKHTL